MSEIRAIQTRYHGCHFRSRIEARWAVFFDTLGIPWEYEKEGFEFPYPSGSAQRHLPDFWLPVQQCWIEIKGEYPTETETDLLRLVVVATRADGFIFFGGMPFPDGHVLAGEYESAIRIDFTGEDNPSTGWDMGHQWCECPQCGEVGIQFEGRADRLPCRLTGCEGDGNRQDRGHNACSPRLTEAYRHARSARFDNRPPGGLGGVPL